MVTSDSRMSAVTVCSTRHHSERKLRCLQSAAWGSFPLSSKLYPRRVDKRNTVLLYGIGEAHQSNLISLTIIRPPTL